MGHKELQRRDVEDGALIRRFDRFELKYVLPVEKCRRLLTMMSPRVAPDQHGRAGAYPIVNLYYDSPRYELFWAKVRKVALRRKLRVRIYPSTSIASVERGLIEVKQRHGQLVRKRRLELSLERAGELLKGRMIDQALDETDRKVALEVVSLSQTLRLKPVVVTSYWREAYEGWGENAGLRVTCDTFVACRADHLVVNASVPCRLMLPADRCIMEVKAEAAMPEWLSSILKRHGCRPEPVSKYCLAVSRLHGLRSPPHFHVESKPMDVEKFGLCKRLS